MFAMLDKAKPDTENIRDLNLAVVRHTTVQVIKHVLQPELPMIGYEPGVGVGVLLAADSQSTSKSGYRASLWDP
jgi:hypothetical protein